MPILIMGLIALAVFVSMLFMFFSAMSAERRKREETQGARPEAPKSSVQSAGR